MKNFLLLFTFIILAACQVKTNDGAGGVVTTPSDWSITMTATSNIVADGVATSTIDINVQKAGVAQSGVVPTFGATGSGNIIGTCTATNITGDSSCTLKSTKAEVKGLRVLTPDVSNIVSVTFLAGSPSASATTVTASGPVVANGIASSTVTITVKDAFGNVIAGETPTFTATDTGSTNVYSACSVSNASGVSTCTIKSTKAEVKSIDLLTPVSKTAAANAIFVGGAPVVANSDIIGTTPVTADGIDASTITITLADAYGNPSLGYTPTFSATGTNNTYGACSLSDATGSSTCTLKSTSSGTKTLNLLTPVAKTGSSVVFDPASPTGADPANSTITGTSTVIANGVATSTITITLNDSSNNPVVGQTPTFSATDTGTTNVYGACSATNASGVSTCTLASTKAEAKVLAITSPISKTDGSVTFIADSPSASSSSIVGTTPVTADGLSSSAITITLRDAFNNPVAGETPIFVATDTGIDNIYGACSATNALGISTCTLASTTAETKTLQLMSPVAVTGNNVVFQPTGPDAGNSSITGTTPVVADGVETSTITITLKDTFNNPVSGVTPTFSATNTGGSNSYGVCSATDGSGESTCTLSSLKAETKTLNLLTPVSKTGGTVVFVADSAVAVNSTITGTGPVIADGVATSTVTITLKDANNNAVVGEVPTFGATDGGTDNSYGTCSATNTSGISTCTLSSLTPEVKTLSILTPVSKSGGTVTFTAGSAVALNSTITGTSPVVADGVASSTITITLKDAGNNPVAGQTPTFNATDTGTTNVYGACSVSDANGESTCTLTSLVAEIKTLAITSPVSKSDGTVTFTAGGASATNSTITGSGPVVADGSANSTITVTLKDANNNPVVGQTPTFSATDTGTTNSYGTCSATNASGISTCTLSSTKAEVKTLAIVTPVAKSDGSVTFTAGAVAAAGSDITGTSPVVADGVATSTISIYLRDAFSNPVAGQTPTFSATNTGSSNTYGTCSASDATGLSTCTLSSLNPEVKTLSILTPVSKTGGTVTFTSGSAVAVNSTIVGTSPVVADGTATSTVTITLRDASNNPVAGETPTFSATDTGATNVYSSCSITDVNGESTCTLKSLVAEVKTLAITSPVSKTGGTVTFTAGGASATNSTITGTGPVVADGSSTSTITISLKDANNNPVAGQTPTFSATNTGTTNTYGTCSATNASGVSTCTLSSTKAEVKTLAIVTPVAKTDGTVTFIAGTVAATGSSITGTGPVVANNTATSTVSIYLRDAFSNPVSGQTPTFSATDTGTTNTYGSCSASDATGLSTCTLKSTKAEVKTLSILTPVSKSDGTVTFIAGAASASTSSIAGTGPVPADGSSTSTIVITLLDAFSNPVIGTTPTFSATNSGSTNTYGACSATDSSGVSNCTLSSTYAETKTLSITAPVSVTGSTVVFEAGAISVANSNITGTGPVVADGVATSTITISLKDASNNGVAGVTPTFAATNTGSTNSYGTCSVSDSNGESTCTLTSTKAETKTLNIATPINRSGGTVQFIAGSASTSTSTITGTGPVVADGSATSSVTITLLDAFNNPIAGTTPTFDATNTGTTNNYGTCSSTNASGVSTCTLASLKAEVKTLSITSPVTKADGTVTFTAGTAVAANSTITGTGPVPADGSSTSTVTITLMDMNNNAVAGVVPTFSATDTGTTNSYGTCSATDASGISTCTLTSLMSETKTLSITAPVTKTGGTVVFTAGAPVAINSTITGSGPVLANGVATSTVTITLRDAANTPVEGQVPTFVATNTGNTNVYGTCSATDSSGISTCTLKSTTAEVKTLSIVTPVSKSDGTVTFTAGSAVASTSLISGTTNVIADGVATSTITISLNDAFNNPVSGITPTFTATNTGTTNTYGTCSASSASGQSTCTLRSTKAEVKTLSITAPFTKAGSTVTFIAGAVSATNSDITGTSPVSADGVSVSFITVTLNDAFNNPIQGSTPIFNATDTGSNNVYGACSSSNASGVSTCTLASTTAEVKTLQMTSPVAKTGSTPITFSATLPTSANSTITGTGPVVADGTDESSVTITLRDASNNPVPGIVPEFDATDTGATNNYIACSMSDASGVSSCSMSSTKAEAKTLRITNPVLKSGTVISFVAGAVEASTSSISGTGPVIANGTATSSINITLMDAFSNPVSGMIPTFSATNTGSTNNYGICSTTNASGVSTCTLTSTKAESKIPQITSPVTKSGSAIQFIAGPAVAGNSTITGTGPVTPNGTAVSTITITLNDAFMNHVPGATPTFTATGTNNTYGTCSSSSTLGVSTCTLASTTAEIKTLSIATPVSVTGGTVEFAIGAPIAENSEITGTGPVIANGVATSTITIILRDDSFNPVSGLTPVFSADGTGNSYGSCTVTNASGVSTCTMTSTVAEDKTLQIDSPISKIDGTVSFIPGPASIATSTIVAETPVIANGIDICTVTVTVKDAQGNPISGTVPTISMSGTLNSISTCTSTDTSGVATCDVTSTKPELKSVQLLTPASVAGNSVEFNPIGINIQVPIELLDRGAASNTSAVTFARSRTTLNPADYVAQTNTYMFEVVAENTNTSTAYSLHLVDSAGVQITDSQISIPANTTAPTRFNVIWTPNATASNYRLRVPATAVANQVKVHSARIIVEQTAAVATKIYIPLTNGDITADSNSDTTFVTSTSSTSFATSNFFTIWTRNDSLFDAIDTGTPWTLETVSSISNTAGTATIALHDKVAGTVITGAQTTVTGTGSTSPSLRTASFASNATNFNNGDILELRMRSSGSSRTARVFKAGLWLKLKFLRKVEIPFRLATRAATGTNIFIPDSRTLYDQGAWTNPSVFFEANAVRTGTSTVVLMRNTANSGTTGTTVTTLTPTTTFGSTRSAALTMTDMDRYYIQHTSNAVGNVLGSAFLYIRSTE